MMGAGSTVASTLLELFNLWWSIVAGIFALFRGNFGLEAKRTRWREGMENSRSYPEWYQHAMEYCNSYGYYDWRRNTSDGYFNYAEIKHRTQGIRTLLAELQQAEADHEGDDESSRRVLEEKFEHLLTHLRSDLVRGPCGICRPIAFTFRIGTKKLIEEYVEEIQRALNIIARFEPVDVVSRYNYLNECLKNHGKTALLLSGGQSLSLYHLGVCRFLHSMHFLPRVVCGAGTAAVIASFVCCHRDHELMEFLDPNGGKLDFGAFIAKSKQGGFLSRCARRIRRFSEHGTLMDIEVVADFVEKHLGDITFKEAFEKTGRVLNIVICNLRECVTVLPHTQYTISQSLLGSGETMWVANYLTAPDVLVRTAALAAISQGVFGSWLWKGYALKRKNPVSGDIELFSPCAYTSSSGETAEAMAINRLSEQFNVTCVIRARNSFRLFHSHTPSPVSPDLKSGPLKRFLGRLKTEVQRETLHRVYGILRALRRLPYIGPTSTKILSLDPFLRDVEVDVELTSSQASLVNLLEHPSAELVAKGLREGEKSTWHSLSTIQLHLAVEDTFSEILTRLQPSICSGPDRLVFSDFPFPQVLDTRVRPGDERATRSSFTIPFPIPKSDGGSGAGDTHSDTGSVADFGHNASYGCGFGSMIMRHVEKHRNHLLESPRC